MAFKFAWLCELLDQLDQNRLKRATTTSGAVNTDNRIIISWFNKHSHHIHRRGEEGIALLSSLFPEHRSDRVYNLQEKRLSSLFGRVLRLPAKRVARLNGWMKRDGADFACCVEEVMREAEFNPPSPARSVTIEQIDRVLNQLAANSPYSSSKLRSNTNNKSADELLRPIVLRLQSSEAKWLVRMLLKSFSPVQVPEFMVMHEFHFLMPDILTIQNNFEAAIAVLSTPELESIPPRQDRDAAKAFRMITSHLVVPQLGVMVKRQPYDKARSIKHCCRMADNRTMSIERKYDGEYCQIHINMEAKDRIKIFSKSGKDSTIDRIRLHGAIEDALELRNKECLIKCRCILEGELLVWNRSQGAIQEFSKIRRHVKHGGRSLGTNSDSPPSLDEHLMIVFYDILLLDEMVALHKAHRERRQILEELIKTADGFAGVSERDIIDFRSRKAPEQLRTAFARAITDRWEGFVLKGCDDPYFSFQSRSQGIKLKKDYIKGLGDTADMAIVGGSRDPVVEQELGLGKLCWTSFDLACLENKEEVRRFNAKPIYCIVGSVSQHCISKENIQLLNRLGKFCLVDPSAHIPEIQIIVDEKISKRPQNLFRKPFVADIYGAGFVKPSNAAYYFLRFARVEKIHGDRGVEDVISFDELQNLAKESINEPAFEDSQETRDLVTRLLEADGESSYIDDTSQSTTPRKSNISTATASPSPIVSRKRKSPTLIRVDTGELSPSQRMLRLSGKTVAAGNNTSPAGFTLGGTEKDVLSIADCIQATASTKCCKVNLLAASTSFPVPIPTALLSSSLKQTEALPSRQDRNSTTRLASKRTISRLKRTPPWCTPSSKTAHKATQVPSPSTTFSGLPGPSKQISPRRALHHPALISGEPLAEITNKFSRSPGNPSRAAINMSKPTAMDKGSLKLGPARTRIRRLQETTKTVVQNPVTMQPLNGLLTPPTSSPDEPDEQISETSPKRRKDVLPGEKVCKPVASASENSKPQPVHDRGLREAEAAIQPSEAGQANDRAYQSLDPTCPLLLSSSLSTSSRATVPPLDTLLQEAHPRFTSSKKNFLHQILSSSSTAAAIVLVDWQQPETVAKEMKALALDLREELKSTPPTAVRQGRLIVLHWKCLRELENGQVKVDLGRRYFGGCLTWSLGVEMEGENWVKMRAVWDGEEVLAG